MRGVASSLLSWVMGLGHGVPVAQGQGQAWAGGGGEGPGSQSQVWTPALCADSDSVAVLTSADPTSLPPLSAASPFSWALCLSRVPGVQWWAATERVLSLGPRAHTQDLGSPVAH